MASPLAMALSGQPPMQGMPSPTVGPTDIAGIYRDAYTQQMEKYKADMARKNAMWGGLASLAGTLGGAAMLGPVGAKVGGMFCGGVTGLSNDGGMYFGDGSQASMGGGAGGGVWGA